VDPEYEQFCRGALADPYPLLHRLRTEDPVHWSERLNSWVLTRYADVYAAFLNPRLASSRVSIFVSELPETMRSQVAPLREHLSNWMLFSDPPNHTRLRNLLGKTFTPGIVENMRAQLQDIVDGLLDKRKAAGRMDLIADFAYLLPVTVICEMLGIPARDHDRFRHWSEDIVAFTSAGGPARAATAARSQQSLMELSDYFRGVIADCRHNRPDTLLGELVAVEEQGDRLTERELVSMCTLLFIAGHETTTNLIGNGMLALLQNPAEFKKLKENPTALMNSAIEELLRYEAPLQRQTRVAKEDLQIGGKSIRKGDAVLLMQGAANRDPAQFPDPDHLNIARPEKENRHVAFGWGSHFCVGAPLARIEAQVAFGTILRRAPGIRLVAGQKLEWRQSMGLRGLKALHVEIGARN